MDKNYPTIDKTKFRTKHPPLLPRTIAYTMPDPISANALLTVQHLTKSYAQQTIPAVFGVDLQVASQEIIALLGPSGCGKTTLLRLIAGFETPDRGEIYLEGRPITHLPPEARGIGMVFQDFALFPHLTCAQNVAFGLHKKAPKLRPKIVQEVLELVGLQDLRQRLPHQLSGGQQQRLALARALAPDPTLILLDEPLSNLDAQIRWQLRSELRRILKSAGKSAILVTHDQEEALHIADRVAVMRAGKIEQLDTPQGIYEHPQTAFVAEFVCQANNLWAQYGDQGWETIIGTLPLSIPQAMPVEMLVRPESLHLHPDPQGTATIVDRLFLGREVMYILQTHARHTLIARSTSAHAHLPVGTTVAVTAEPQEILLFPQSGQNV
jgi:iron(III) transport system ATP-binding protein